MIMLFCCVDNVLGLGFWMGWIFYRCWCEYVSIDSCCFGDLFYLSLYWFYFFIFKFYLMRFWLYEFNIKSFLVVVIVV